MSALLIRRGSQFVPSLVHCRHGSKHHIKHPKTHFARQVMEAITRPVLPYEFDRSWCPQVQKDALTELKPISIETEGKSSFDADYESFLVRQCKKIFEENEMVLVCQTLHLSKKEQKLIRNKLFYKGVELEQWSNNIIIKAIEDTVWQNMKPLFVSHTILLYGQSNIPELYKIMKRVPQMTILGGVVHGSIVSQADIVSYAALPPIETLHAELVGCLSHAASNTHRLLSSHQQNLSQNLAQYIRDQEQQ